METEDTGPYMRFWKEIKRRTVNPLTDLTFIFYVFFGVVVFGGLGVWIEVVKYYLPGQFVDMQGIRTALAVFYPALIGAASLQLVLESVRKSETLMSVFAITSLLVMIISAILLGLIEYFQASDSLLFWVSSGLSALGLWVWVIANADNPDLKTRPNPESASGGDVKRQLRGDVSGFQK